MQVTHGNGRFAPTRRRAGGKEKRHDRTTSLCVALRWWTEGSGLAIYTRAFGRAKLMKLREMRFSTVRDLKKVFRKIDAAAAGDILGPASGFSFARCFVGQSS